MFVLVSLLSLWEMRELPVISIGAQATGLSPTVWVANLWTFDRLLCKLLDPFPGRDLYSSKDLCFISVNQLTQEDYHCKLLKDIIKLD